MGTRRRRGRGGKNRKYFTEEVEQAIIDYNSEKTPKAIKVRIYTQLIHPAFDKLVENLIHTFKFYYFDSNYIDLKHEVVSFLTEKIGKYKNEKGKAFSYFTIVGKNYLILYNTKNYKQLKEREELVVVDEERNIPNEISRKDYNESLSDFIDIWIEDIDEILEEMFPNNRDQAIADSILELFRIRKSLESFNKKNLYVLIRERTGFKTQRITKIVNILKEDFYIKFNEYLNE